MGTREWHALAWFSAEGRAARGTAWPALSGPSVGGGGGGFPWARARAGGAARARARLELVEDGGAVGRAEVPVAEPAGGGRQ